MPIYSHHIVDMADGVAEALADRPDGKSVKLTIREALATYWSDLAAIVWTVGDILGEFPTLTREQACGVLQSIVDDHDASVGVCWDNLSVYVHRAVPRYGEGDEVAGMRRALAAFAARVGPDDFHLFTGMNWDGGNSVQDADEDELRDACRGAAESRWFGVYEDQGEERSDG